MDCAQLRDYVNNTVNLSALQRVVRSKNPRLYHAIVHSWRFPDEAKNFVEQVYHFLNPDETIYCDFGKRMKFNGYRALYSCERQCECVTKRKQHTMLKRHGVAHALQSEQIRERFRCTLQERH